MSIRDLIASVSPPRLIGQLRTAFFGVERASIVERIMFVYAIASDLLIERAFSGVNLRHPGKGDPTGLPYVGFDRRIRRGFFESNDTYAARLRAWLDTWRRAGTASGPITAVAATLAPIAPLIESVLEGYTFEGDPVSTWDVLPEGASASDLPVTTHVNPANWVWDRLGYFKRRWLIIRDKNEATGEAWATSTRKWGDGLKWGDKTVSWGFNEPPDMFRTLVFLVTDWKSAAARYWAIIINFRSDRFDPSLAPGDPLNPDADYGAWSKIDASGVRPVRVRARTRNARYISGVYT